MVEGDNEMARCGPGSQTREIMAEKERIARKLLAQGLTVTQICKQLRCSPQFVRQARENLRGEIGNAHVLQAIGAGVDAAVSC
jgi:transposase-like protein